MHGMVVSPLFGPELAELTGVPASTEVFPLARRAWRSACILEEPGPRFAPEVCTRVLLAVSLQQPEVCSMTLGTILLILFIIILIGALPTWPYSSGWGYYPSSGAGLVLLIVVILLVMGRI
jgi:Protein of unknown function (DUF3309)